MIEGNRLYILALVGVLAGLVVLLCGERHGIEIILASLALSGARKGASVVAKRRSRPCGNK